MVRKARQNYSSRESVVVSLCTHTPGTKNSTKHFPDAAGVFTLNSGGGNSFLLLSADVLIDHCSHNPKLKNTRGLVKPHISREWHLLSDSITHKHTHHFTHCGLWENERNTCIFQLHRTFISYVRLTRSFEEEKERKHVFLRRQHSPVSRLVRRSQSGWMW